MTTEAAQGEEMTYLASLRDRLLEEAKWNRGLSKTYNIAVITEEHNRRAELLEQAAAAIPADVGDAKPAELLEPVAEIVEAKEYKTKAIMFLDSFEGLPVGTKLYASPRIAMPENVREALKRMDDICREDIISTEDLLDEMFPYRISGSWSGINWTSYKIIRAFVREVTGE